MFYLKRVCFFCSSSFVLAKTTVKRFATTIQYCFLLIYSAICKFITAPYEITWKFNRSAVFSNVGRCDVTHCLCYGCACYLKRVCPNGNADDITVRLRVLKKNFSCVCVFICTVCFDKKKIHVVLLLIFFLCFRYLCVFLNM